MSILNKMIRFNSFIVVRAAVLPCLVVFLTAAMAGPAYANPAGAPGGGGILNILLLALIAYFLVRMFRRRSGGDSDRDQSDRDQGRRNVRPMDRHEAARQMWEHLTGEEPGEPAPQAEQSAAFDETEFLEGAKLFFSRFQQVNSQGDLEDLRGFMSESVYQDVREMMERDQDFGPGEVMLLTANLMEVKNEAGRTWATVFYDAQIRKGASSERSEHVRTVWEFSRDDKSQGGLWTLESINKVDQ